MKLSDVFLFFVNTAVSAGWVVLGVLVLRLVLGRAPKWTRLLLWAVVGARLVFPVRLLSVFSLIPSGQTIDTSVYMSRPYVATGFAGVDFPINAYLGSHYYEGVTVPAGLFDNILTVLAAVWLAGFGVLLLYALISFWRLKAKLRTATHLQGRVFESEQIASAFILGVFRARIYLPYGLRESDRAYVLAHEQAHLKRRDHLVKPFAFLLLCLYWFQPLLWLAYILLGRDMELACDEKAVQAMDKEARRAYSMALLRNSVRRGFAAASPLAFGEISVKTRVQAIMCCKKPAAWIAVAAVVLCSVAGLVFLTDPAGGGAPVSSYAIEAHAWQFETLQTSGGAVLACSRQKAAAYPHAPVADLTLHVQDDRFTLTNTATGEQWQFASSVASRVPDGAVYLVTATDGTAGMADVRITGQADAGRTCTLVLSAGGYRLQFSSASVAPVL